MFPVQSCSHLLFSREVLFGVFVAHLEVHGFNPPIAYWFYTLFVLDSNFHIGEFVCICPCLSICSKINPNPVRDDVL